MKKTRKLIALLLLLIMILVACDSKDVSKENTFSEVTNKVEEQTKEENVEGLVAEISVQVEEEWLPYYQDAAKRVLLDNPESTINFITTNSFDHLNILDSTDVMNEEIADVFAIPVERIYDLAKKEDLAGIDALTMAENIGGYGDFDSGLGGYFNIDGYYLAFPMNIETLVNFVNTANAESNAIDLTQNIEFRNLSYQDMLLPIFNAWYAVAFTNAVGIEMLAFDETGMLYSDLTKEYSDLSSTQKDVMIELFNYWKKHENAGIHDWDEDATYKYMDTEFATGGMNSIRMEGSWSLARLSEESNFGKDLTILPITQVSVAGNPIKQWRGGWGLAINARIEGEEERMLLAQAMIEEIVNPKFALDFYESTGKVLENVDLSIYEASNLSESDKEMIRALITSYKAALARPVFMEWNQVWGTWKNAILSWDRVKPVNAQAAYKEIKSAFDTMMLSF